MKIQSLMTIQIIKIINVDGALCHIGDQITINSERAKRMISLGYARKVDLNAPYDYPVKDKSFGFHPVKFDDEKKQPAKVLTPKPKTTEKKGDSTEAGVPEFKDFLSGFAIGALRKEGIYTLADLKGMTRERLLTIPKISEASANKLEEMYRLHIEGIKPESKMKTIERELED